MHTCYKCIRSYIEFIRIKHIHEQVSNTRRFKDIQNYE